MSEATVTAMKVITAEISEREFEPMEPKAA